MKLRLKKYSQYDHEIPDISRSLTAMNSIKKKQIGLFTRDEEKHYILHKESDRK